MFNAVCAQASTTATITICTTANAAADCDFVADGINDQIEIQAAIDKIFAESTPGAIQAGAGGKGKIVFKEGIYHIGGTIFLKPGIHFEGQHLTSTILKAADDLNANMFEFKEDIVQPSAGVVFEALYFDGNKFNNIKGSGLDTKTGKVALWDVHFVRCLFFDFPDTVLLIRDPWGFCFTESQIEDSNEGAIYISSSNVPGSKHEGASILNSKIIQNGAVEPASAIVLEGVDASRIVGNEINSYGKEKFAVEIINGKQNSLVGNNITAGTNGFYTNFQSAGNMFIGNALRGLTNHGVIIAPLGGSNILVGNTFTFVGGIELADFGTDTVRYGNRGDNDNKDDHTNQDMTPNPLAIGTFSPKAQLHVRQGNNTSDQPVLELEQKDADAAFVNFTGTQAGNGNIVKNAATQGAKFGALKVKVNGQTKWLRLYDSAN